MMATAFQTQRFAVPMTNMNLPPSEALNQIMDNLNHLNVIVNQAVNTIHFRIKQESELLSSISKRINNAYKKTALIASNPNKSTTIYSLSNYPNNTINAQTDKPLINKATHNLHPITPQRSNYNLSLKQRNQKPKNTETVSLLHSIHQKTQKIKTTESKTQQIPEWVESIADCMVFGTNCNAYSPSKNTDFKRTRYQKRKKLSINNGSTIIKQNDSVRMAAAPPSICDKNYNLKTQRKTYGDRIKYRCVLDRENMPKFQVDSNLFHKQNTKNINNVSAVTDIKWNNNNQEQEQESFIPSDVLNENEIKLDEKEDEKEEEKAEELHIHTYPTPKDIVAEDELKQTNVSVGVEEQENEADIKQSFVFEVEAQNESLQKMEDENIEEKRKEDDDANRSVVRFVFDVNALREARGRLNKIESKSKSESGREENEDDVQGTIFSAMKNLRRFHADSDDEEDDTGSFDDSDY